MTSDTFNFNGYKYHKYCPPSPEETGVYISALIKGFERFLLLIKDNISNYFIDTKSLAWAAIRVNQRMLHYMMYYSETEMNEMKHVALICYWLMRYQPIVRVKPDFRYGSVLERFCIHIIYSVVRHYRENNFNGKLSIVDTKVFNDILYSFKHRQHSYDSMVLLVETMAKIA